MQIQDHFNVGLSDEQELLLQNLQELLLRDCSETYQQECDIQHSFPLKAYRSLADNGFLALGLPEELGGVPSDSFTKILIMETLGRLGGVPLAGTYVGQTVNLDQVAAFGTDEQKERVLSSGIAGNSFLALSVTEPLAGSDSSAISCSHNLQGDKVVLNGQKTWCTGADIAEHLILCTVDAQATDSREGISMWLVPTDAPGLKIAPIPKIGWFPANSCEVFLDNVTLPASSLLGQLNNGWKQLMRNFGLERTTLAALCVGVAQAALDDAAMYANQRVQFGDVIGSFQGIQNTISEMALKIELARNLVYKVAYMVDAGESIRIEAAMAKLYASRIAFEVCDDAMQIFGGIGVMSETRVSRLWRDVRLYRIGGGTDGMMYRAIGPMVLRKYK